MAYFGGDLNFPWGKLKEKKKKVSHKVKLAAGARAGVTDLEPFPLRSPLPRFLEGFAGGKHSKMAEH